MTKSGPLKIGDIVVLEYGKGLQNYRDGIGNYDVFGTNGKIGKTDQILYDKPAVIIGRKGAYREVHLAPDPFFVIDTAFYTRNLIKDLDTHFLYYWFKNIDINAMDSGSAIPSTSRDEVYDLEIDLPPLPEQQSIASVLSNLDDKIDLLQRQNKTLEAMAETLFRQWFVEEAQEDWQTGPLSDFVDIGIGRTPPRKEHQWFSENARDMKWISIKDLGNDGTYIFNTAEFLTRDAVVRFNIPVIPRNTVVLSFKMTVGRVAISSEVMLSNEAIAHFKFRSNTPFTVEFLFMYLKLFRYESLGSTSSIVTAINSAMIKEMEIMIPDPALMLKFDEIVSKLFKKIKSNQVQIGINENIRDILLPKLMSGEVWVKS